MPVGVGTQPAPTGRRLGRTTTVYVSNAGSDSNQGTPSSPVATLAEARRRTSGWETIALERGSVFRETMQPRLKQTFTDYGSGAKPEVNGAIVLTGWTSEDVGRSFTAYYVNETRPSYNDIFEDNARLTEVGSKSNLTPGDWYYDSGNGRIYVRTTGDDAPSNYTIEKPDLTRCLYQFDGPEDLRYENIVFTKADRYSAHVRTTEATGPLNGAIFQNCGFFRAGDYGLHVRNAGDIESRSQAPIKNFRASNCQFNYNKDTGLQIGNRVTDAVVEDCEAAYNRCEKDFSAGIRYTSEYSQTGSNPSDETTYNRARIFYRRNECHDNGDNTVYGQAAGYGLHDDTSAKGTVIKNNTCYSNGRGGIKCEWTGHGVDDTVGQGGGRHYIVYNTTYGNGTQTNTVGEGISLSRRSHDNILAHNTCYETNGDRAVTVAAESSGNDPIGTKNNDIKNNIFVGGSAPTLRVPGSGDGAIREEGNEYTYNCWGSSPELFYDGSTYTSYSAFETAYGAETFAIEADPNFVDPTNQDFTLAGPPCIDAATSISAISQDSDPDVGAVESGSDTTAPTISNVTLGNDGSGNLSFSFDSDKLLAERPTAFAITVNGPDNANVFGFDNKDFSRSGSGPYTYSLTTTQAFNDGQGTYEVVINDAIDYAGNDGADGTQTDTHAFSLNSYSISPSDTSPTEGDTITWSMSSAQPAEGELVIYETDASGNRVQEAVRSSVGVQPTVDQTFSTEGDYYFEAVFDAGAAGVQPSDEDLNASPDQISVQSAGGAVTGNTLSSDDLSWSSGAGLTSNSLSSDDLSWS